MVVISIIALFTAFGFMKFAEAKNRAQDTKKITEIGQIEKAIVLQKDTLGRVPKNYNCDGTYCAAGGGNMSAAEGIPAYDASMQELVIGGYLPSIPKSIDGTYVYYSDSTGQIASFGATLKSSASSGKTGNSCSIIGSSNVSYQKCVGLDSGGAGAKWASTDEGVMWQSNGTINGTTACAAKSMRLPTGIELQAQKNAGYPSGGFSATSYWSANKGGMGGKALYLNVATGQFGYHPVSMNYSVRCVQ